MKARQFFNLIITVFYAGILASCAEVEPEEVKFQILANGGSFTGTYTLDSGTPVSLTGASIGNDVFFYEKTVDVDNQLEIDASPVQTDETATDAPTSLEIKVYRDKTFIKKVQDISSPIEKISLTYSSGEASETS